MDHAKGAANAAVLISAAEWVGRMRVVPFTTALASGLEKVRAALGASAQRQLLGHLDELQYVGIPAHAVPESVRSAVERAWFEQCPLRMTYRDRDGVCTERVVRIRRVLMDRGETRLQCDDLEKAAAREFVLHRIEAACVAHSG